MLCYRYFFSHVFLAFSLYQDRLVHSGRNSKVAFNKLKLLISGSGKNSHGKCN